MNKKYKRILLFLFIGLFFSFASFGQTAKGIKAVSTETPSSTRIVQGNTYALIVGISKYQSSAIPQLNYADADARAFHDFLTSSAGGKVQEENILMLLNDSAKVGDIEMHGLAWLEEKNAKKGDRVFIYFSGHGITIGNNDSYLLANDIKEGFNKYNIMLYNGIPVMQLKRNTIQPMTAEGVEVFLLIDACRTRAVENERNNIKLLTSNSALTENAGDIMLISAENEQSSQEDNPANQKWGGHGVFTYYLLNGLEGMADGMGDREDGVITLGELKHYLSDNVNKSTNYLQTPFISDGNNHISLSNVDAPTLAALKQKLQQTGGEVAFAPNTSKGIVATDADSTAQSTYTLFSEALSKRKLLGDSSADYYFTKLEDNSHVGSLKQHALYSLCAALMNDGQKIINAYLNSDLKSLLKDNDYSTKKVDMIFAKGEIKMNRLYELREKYFKGNKYNENVKAQWLFMKARKWAHATNKKQLNEAKEAIQQAIKIDTTQACFYLTLAMIYLSDDNFKMALSEVQKALLISDNWSYALFGAGALYFNLKEFDKAEPYFLETIQRDSTFADAYAVLGLTYQYLKQNDKAEAYCLKALQLDSASTNVYKSLGGVYLLLKQYDKAKQYLLKAIQLDSTSSDSYQALGCVYFYLKQYDKAEQYCLIALQLDSTNSEAYSVFGAIYASRNKYDKAEQCWLKAIQRDSTDKNNYDNLASLYDGLKKYNKAEIYFLKLIQLDSSSAEGYDNLGGFYFYRKQYDKAVPIFLKAIQVDSTNANAYIYLGAYYMNLKQYDKAEPYCIKAIQLDSTETSACSNLGTTYAELKQYDKAEPYLLKAIQLDSTNANAYNNLAYLLIPYIGKTLKQKPDDPDILYNMAGCYSMIKKKSKSLKYLEKSLKSGLKDYDNIQQNSYLNNIRKEPEFKTMMAKYFPDKEK